MSRQSILRNATQILASLTFFVLGFAAWGFAADAKETIDATARGTSTQMGRDISIKVLIYSYSTEEDRQTLKAAFAKGQSQGLADALSKMKAVGRIQIPGTLGYELGYVRMIEPRRRKIRFAANRKIAFARPMAIPRVRHSISQPENSPTLTIRTRTKARVFCFRQRS